MQLALVVLFHPPTGANTALALGQLALCGGGLCGDSCICGSGGVYMKTTQTLSNLHCVVVVCGGGSWIMWKWRIYRYYKTLLAHVVVSPIATSAVSVLPSTQWCRYQAYARATCTVWWCTSSGGGRCILVCGGGGCCYGVLVLGKCTGVSQRKY